MLTETRYVHFIVGNAHADKIENRFIVTPTKMPDDTKTILVKKIVTTVEITAEEEAAALRKAAKIIAQDSTKTQAKMLTTASLLEDKASVKKIMEVAE